MSQKFHQSMKEVKLHIWPGHAWVGLTSLDNLWTILGLVLGGPVGLGGPIFSFWGTNGLIFFNFKTAVAGLINELDQKSHLLTFSSHNGLTECGKKRVIFFRPNTRYGQ